MRKSRHAQKQKLNLKINIIVYVYIITTIMLLMLSFSRYVTNVSTDSVSSVAVMASDVSLEIDLTDGVYPGYNTKHAIKMSNFEGEKVCDVAQEFVIDIDGDEFENIPLNYTIYTDAAFTNAVEKDSNGNYAAEEFRFEAGTGETKTCYLEVDWPADKNDEEYAFEIGYCTINIIATQID